MTYDQIYCFFINHSFTTPDEGRGPKLSCISIRTLRQFIYLLTLMYVKVELRYLKNYFTLKYGCLFIFNSQEPHGCLTNIVFDKLLDKVESFLCLMVLEHMFQNQKGQNFRETKPRRSQNLKILSRDIG